MTDLDSAGTLLLSWIVAPAIVVLGAAGLGLGMARLTGVRLGALTLPTGFLTGMAVMGSLLYLSLSAWVVVGITLALALAGPVIAALRRRRLEVGRVLRAEGRWAVTAGCVAFVVGMAPLVGTGHAGILGYVLNDDSAVHTSSIELLLAHGANTVPADSSFTQVSGEFASGYPLGSYVWPMLIGALTGIDAFLSWTPMLAVAATMTSLAAFAIARRLGASGPVAAVGGVVVASGYLPFSFLATSSPKEVMLGTGVLTTVAVAMLALDRGVTARRVLAPGVTLAGAISCFGIGSLSPLGPALVLAALIGLLRAGGRRLRAAAGLAGGVAVTFLVAAPAVLASLHFTASSARITHDPNAVGNLLGAVPWQESLNVWLAGDYRFAHPQYVTLTTAGIVLAVVLAAIGVIASLRRRDWAVPLLVLGTAIAAKYVETSYSSYFETKIYVVLGVVLGMASFAGVVAIVRHPRTRRLGFAVGAIWVVLVAASDAAVYRQVWTTPEGRFEELARIDQRFAGQGPILVNDREDYGKEILRDVKPWDSWDVWTPDNGLSAGLPPPPPHAPDFDDYQWAFIKRFPLLLQRRRPGGSLPPEGFTVAARTQHYVVWRRTGSLAVQHLPLGTKSRTGTAKLRCGAPTTKAFLTAARGRPLRAAYGVDRMPALDALDFNFLPPALGGPTPDAVYRRGGVGFTRHRFPAGHWVAWIQGQFGPGVRVEIGGRTVGEAKDDLGIYDAWHRLGPVTIPPGGARPRMVGLRRPPWEAGMRRLDLTGTIALEPAHVQRRIVTVPAGRHRSLCGQRLDWVESR